jgi:hypothetical protein
MTCHWRYKGREEVRLYSLLTSALERNEWLTPRLGRFTPGKQPWYPLYRRLGELQGPVWVGSERKTLTSTRFRNPDNQTLDNSLHRLCSPGLHFRGLPEYVFGGPERKVQWVCVIDAPGDRRIVLLPACARDSSSPKISNRTCVPSSLTFNGKRQFYRWHKAVGAWNWQIKGSEWQQLCLHSPPHILTCHAQGEIYREM